VTSVPPPSCPSWETLAGSARPDTSPPTTAPPPIEASSGDVKRHRLNQGGNRQLNAAIHIAAVTQIRHDTDGRVFFRRKLAEHKTEGEAMRALKRQLSNVIHRRLLVDQRRREAARGGQAGTRLASA
jgi:transposase